MQRPDPKKILAALIEINSLENELIDKPRTTKRAAIEESIQKLRADLPKPILSHHDRIKLRRRSSVAVVKNWFCGGCHIEIPRGSHRVLQFGQDLVICENCGCYVHLAPEETTPGEEAKVVAEKPAKAPRKRASLATA